MEEGKKKKKGKYKEWKRQRSKREVGSEVKDKPTREHERERRLLY